MQISFSYLGCKNVHESLMVEGLIKLRHYEGGNKIVLRLINLHKVIGVYINQRSN